MNWKGWVGVRGRFCRRRSEQRGPRFRGGDPLLSGEGGGREALTSGNILSGGGATFKAGGPVYPAGCKWREKNRLMGCLSPTHSGGGTRQQRKEGGAGHFKKPLQAWGGAGGGQLITLQTAKPICRALAAGVADTPFLHLVAGTLLHHPQMPSGVGAGRGDCESGNWKL